MLEPHRVQLADHLERHLDRIVDIWMAKVRADPRLTTADTLSEPQLKDHVPRLLADLVRSLREGVAPGRENTKSNADKHGVQRWQQGYRLRELLLEMFWLRTVLFREATDLAAGQPDELARQYDAGELMDKFLNDIESHSVAEFVEANKEELHKANQETLRIIRTVSHELRNMLNSVGLAFGLLDAGDRESVEQMRRNLTLNSEHMTAVLDELLDLSNILSGASAIKQGPFNFAGLLEFLHVSFARMAESKGLVFTMSADPALGVIHGDELKIRQIIENLVSNAIKYTYTGEVRLKCEAVGEDEMAIVVEDTGVGIAKIDRELVVSESYHVNPESPLRGSGLGLWIVARLVKLLNGSIELRSEPEKGSVFKVVLPRG